MIKRLNPSVTKKLIWLAFLVVATFCVTHQTNQDEAIQLNQPVINTQAQDVSSAPLGVAGIPTDYRSSYKFVERQSATKKQ